MFDQDFFDDMNRCAWRWGIALLVGLLLVVTVWALWQRS